MNNLLTAILCSSALALLMKGFSSENGSRYGLLLGNYITCTLLSLITMNDVSILTSLSPFTVITGVVGGFLFLFGLLSIQTSIPVNGAALTSAFSKLGIIVSIAFSILFFRETPNPLHIPGILLAVIALPLVNHTEDKTQNRHGALILLLLTMLAGGLADTIGKFFTVYGDPAQEKAYLFILFLTAALLTLLLSINEHRSSGTAIRLNELLAGIAVGIPNYFTSLFQLRALAVLPAAFVYTCCSGGTVIMVMLGSRILFQERYNRIQKIGIALILAALASLCL